MLRQKPFTAAFRDKSSSFGKKEPTTTSLSSTKKFSENFGHWGKLLRVGMLIGLCWVRVSGYEKYCRFLAPFLLPLVRLGTLSVGRFDRPSTADYRHVGVS